MNRASKIAHNLRDEGWAFAGSDLDFIKAVAETQTINPKDGRAVRPQLSVLNPDSALNAAYHIHTDLEAGKLLKFNDEFRTILSY